MTLGTPPAEGQGGGPLEGSSASLQNVRPRGTNVLDPRPSPNCSTQEKDICTAVGQLSCQGPESSECCCCSVTKLCLTLCDPKDCSTPGSLSFIISLSLLKLRFITSAMPSNHLILCHPLVLLSSIYPSIRIYSNESVLHVRWPKYWSFSISPFHEYSGLIFFRIDY